MILVVCEGSSEFKMITGYFDLEKEIIKSGNRNYTLARYKNFIILNAESFDNIYTKRGNPIIFSDPKIKEILGDIKKIILFIDRDNYSLKNVKEDEVVRRISEITQKEVKIVYTNLNFEEFELNVIKNEDKKIYKAIDMFCREVFGKPPEEIENRRLKNIIIAVVDADEFIKKYKHSYLIKLKLSEIFGESL